ncbi:hypothetical protein IQ235_13295 [Oscillatoriales cyanobacterium LEGE 11467]|uniref:Uncharacterized protein n=1 Tax=Zarconia navalis LEGE 11467 TaxID=1828826 RepID=A0A928Z8N5_9CYAN|nr:hypothetical protein [Zarconia navalis]MBE9041755.1 hypothetical protein [Zarconia navalis LEGE 11467]
MIQLLQGNQQRVRYRHGDINILGKTDAALPVRRSTYSLNGSSPVHFYLESHPTEGPKYPWGTRTPAVLRLRDRPGHFNIEIPIDSPHLQDGWNQIAIEIEDGEGIREILEADFIWDSHPVSLPLDLRDLRDFESIQDIAQVVDGDFEIDREKNAIVSRSPVGSDILLLLGSPHRSQEATYDVRFGEFGKGWCVLGLSDFFAAHVSQSPDLGIKPGYATAGLATLDYRGRPQIWIAWGDSLYDKEDTWVIQTNKDRKLPIRSGVTYCVRHQVILDAGFSCARFRIWKKGNREPDIWVCQEDNLDLDAHLPKIERASFGLFQYWGQPTQWSNIQVRTFDLTLEDLGLQPKVAVAV